MARRFSTHSGKSSDAALDPLQLLSSLSLSSAPPTPAPPSHTNPSSTFPFLTSPSQSSIAAPAPTNEIVPQEPRTPTFSTRRELGRQRSVRTERRREKFGRVLRGRVEDGGGVDLGQPSPVFSTQRLLRQARRTLTILVAELRRLAWSGIPSEVRPIVWQLLLVSRPPSLSFLAKPNLAPRTTFLSLPSPA